MKNEDFPSYKYHSSYIYILPGSLKTNFVVYVGKPEEILKRTGFPSYFVEEKRLDILTVCLRRWLFDYVSLEFGEKIGSLEYAVTMDKNNLSPYKLTYKPISKFFNDETVLKRIRELKV